MNLFTIDVRIGELKVTVDPALLKVLERLVDVFDDRKEAAALADEVGRDTTAIAGAIPKT